MPFADLLPLFAQGPAGFRGGNNQPPPPDPAVITGILAFYFGCIGFVAIVGYIIRLLHARSMVNCLKQIAPRNRTVEPGTVWLSAIPLIGGIMHIIAMFKLPASLENEYRSRGWRSDGDFGKTLAIVYLVCAFVAFPAAMVVFIMYWVKHNGYTQELMSRPSRREYDDEDEDEDDDRPRSRRSSRRDDDEDDEDDRPRRRRRDED